jgi:hypothetical protein
MRGRVCDGRPAGWVRRIAGLATVLAVAGCASPTLPLPPPMQPSIEKGVDANHIKLAAGCGGAQVGAIIVIENTNSAVADDERISGSIATACGAWDASVYAHSGDVLNVTQESETEVSTPVVVQVP